MADDTPLTQEELYNNARDLAKWANERYGSSPKRAVLALTEVLAEYLKVMSDSDNSLAHNYASACTALNKFTHQKNIFLAIAETGEGSMLQ